MKRRWSAVVLSMLLPVCAFADTFFVEEPTAVGVSKDDAVASSELVRAAVQENPKNHVVANASDAKYVLRPKLVKFGNSYVMTLEKSQNGKEKYSAQLKLQSMDDLDTVSRRLTTSVLNETSVTENIPINDVTETESKHARLQTHPINHWYFGFGPFGTWNMDDPGTRFGWSVAYAWEVQSHFAIKVLGAGAASMGYGAMGGEYFLTDRDMSPVAELDLGYGGADRHSDGFVAGGGVGYQFFRTSSVTLEALLHCATIFEPTHESNPTILGLRIGLYL